MSSELRIDAGELFRRHAAFVARFVSQLGVAEGDANDAVQEVFMCAHRYGGYVSGPAQPTSWLASIAVGVASTYRRTQRRRREIPDLKALENLPAESESPSAVLEAAQSRARFQSLLEHLDMDKRVVFVLFEIERQPCDQIAAGLAIPIGTVYSRLHAARREFSSACERLCAAEGRSQPWLAPERTA